jgi:hypothetical protein
MSDERTTHPRNRLLLDHHDGVLSGRRGAEVATHLEAGCATCADQIAAIAQLTATITDGPLEPPPRAVVRRARALFGQARLRSVATRAREVLARVIFDEQLRPSAALRSTPGVVRRLLWCFEGYEVYATASPRRSGIELRGQVLPRDDDGKTAVCGHVTLGRPGGQGQRVMLDQEGGFVFRGLDAGTYVLRGEVGDSEFRTPPVVLD